MLPLSPPFFGFAVVAILLYWLLCRWRPAGLAVLLAANVYFLASFRLFYPLVLVAAASVDFLIGLKLQELPRERVAPRKALVTLSLLVNVALLAATKTLPLVLSEIVRWTLPLSLSFYCFQSLTYTIDLYRGTREGTRSWATHLAAATLFSTIVAGPINRMSDLIRQLRDPFRLTREDGARALVLIACGLAKKLLIADFLSQNVVNRVFDTPTLYSGGETLFAVWAYALQILFDFSGYTDIAMGVSLLLGLRVPDNFNRPYTAASIAEFWRRWHITFSNWLRDYVYFSLPSARKSKAYNYINPVIVMLLGGLWHGIGWTFLVWGLLHGVGLAAERAFQVWRGKMSGGKVKPTTVTRTISIFCTVQFVCLTWIFFRAPDMATAFGVLGRIGSNTWTMGNVTPVMLGWFGLALSLQLVPADWFDRVACWFGKTPFLLQGAALAVVGIAIEMLAGKGSSTFVYSNF